MAINVQRLRKWLIAAAVLIALGVIAAGVAYQNAKRLLSKDTGPVNADAIVVLGGGGNERPERAAELFKEGAASYILVSGSGDCENNKTVLIEGGIPPDAIDTECESDSTRENALFSIRKLRERKAHRVIVVTTWYHSRRALACFQHYAPDIEFYSRPSFWASERSEWNRKFVTSYIRKEFIKIPGYWVCYGVKSW